MRKIITSAAVAAPAAALLGGTGLAAASSHAVASKTEHFQLMSTSETSNKDSVVATGAFTAGGVDTSGNKTDTVTFPNGSFKLVHKVTGGGMHFNSKTCLLTATETATYTIGHGTGAYAGISGSGKATLSVLGVQARNSKGACSQTLPPAAFELLIKASGPVSLP